MKKDAKHKTIFDRWHNAKIIRLAYKAELARKASELQKNIMNAAPEKWQIPQPMDLSKFLARRQRWIMKARSGFMKKIPGISRWAYQRPVYYTFIFFPNNRMGLYAIEQDFNNTLPMKTRAFQINPKKVWHFGEDSAIFFQHDCAEPLDVERKAIVAKTLNPELYKENLHNHYVSELYKFAEGAISNKIILYVLIGVAAIILIVIAIQAGWITLPAKGG